MSPAKVSFVKVITQWSVKFLLGLQGQIAHFKIPKHIRIVDEIPMTITGKPQKFVMRDNMLALLHSDGEKF